MRQAFGVAGVVLTWVTSTAAAVGPTYHKDVARILQTHCQDCHRPGQVAPFSLLTFDQARKRAGDLVDVTATHTMPPWPASTTDGGPFRDARVLSPAEIATLAAWVAADCPEGNPADGPPAKSWASEWPLGTPDLVLTVPEAYALSASGRDEHRVFVVPSGLMEGRWVSAIDFKPGNAKVVHHILCAFDTAGRARKLDANDPKSGYAVGGGFGLIPTGGLGGWAPGKRATPLPDGIGRYLPAGSDLLIQVHYHKSGKPEADACKVGLYFSKAPVDKQVRGSAVFAPQRSSLLSRPKLLIPADAANYEVKGSTLIGRDATLIGVTPHMHWLGKDFRLVATRPDGSKITLIRIDDWDFNWQGTYDFAKPVSLPKGTRVELLAHFDNSSKNPVNPTSPPVDVHWGEETTDEMCIGFLQLTYDDEHAKNQPPTPRPAGALRKGLVGGQ